MNFLIKKTRFKLCTKILGKTYGLLFVFGHLFFLDFLSFFISVQICVFFVTFVNFCIFVFYSLLFKFLLRRLVRLLYLRGHFFMLLTILLRVGGNIVDRHIFVIVKGFRRFDVGFTPLFLDFYDLVISSWGVHMRYMHRTSCFGCLRVFRFSRNNCPLTA